MKTKKFLLSGILGIAIAGFVLTGCHKASTSPDTDINAAEDESNASTAMNDTKNISDAGMQGNSNKYAPHRNIQAIYSSHCTVSYNDTGSATTDSMIVNFGSSPVQCNDGRWRQGEIIVYWNKNSAPSAWYAYVDSGNTVNMTFNNYFVGKASSNMNGIKGTRAWKNMGYNALGEVNWDFNAALTLTYPTGQTATWNSTRNNTLVYVSGVYYYEITGSAYGTARNGVGYTLTITSPLYVTALPWWVNGGCAWIESGTVTVNRTTNTNVLTINFGTIGTCDDIATATLNGNTYTITLW
jgi:hypothetical protein